MVLEEGILLVRVGIVDGDEESMVVVQRIIWFGFGEVLM